MTFEQIIQQLAKKIYAPVYFLQGNETYFITQIVDYIEKHTLSPEEKSLNLRTYYGKTHLLRDVLSYAKCVPMLGDRQVIIVKEAQEMAILQRAEGQKQLGTYLANPSPTTLLVFAYKHKTLKAKSFVGAFKKTASILYTTPKIYERQIISWINAYVQKRHYTIDPKAALLLQNAIGLDLQRFAHALDKIMLNIPAKTAISVDIVAQQIEVARDFNVFELQDAIGNKQVDKAFQIIDYFGKNTKKNPALPMISALVSFFLKILQLHQLPPMPLDAQAKTLQIHPYFIKNYKTAAKNHPLKATLHHLQALYQADLKLKGIDTPALAENQILKEFVASVFAFN